jgi:YD repeat-containing protein
LHSFTGWVSCGYDARGQLSSVTDAAGHVTRRFEYTAAGLMSAHANALGFSCSYLSQTIAGQPRVLRAITSEGQCTLFRYEPAARTTWAEDELGRVATWRYDEHHQIVQCTDFDGKTYRAEYNAAGLPTVLHLPPTEDGQPRQARLAYDEAGRIVSETDVLGRSTTTRYHRNSISPEAVTLPDGSTWKAEYDHIGRLLKTTDPLGREETYTYPEASASPWPIERTAKGGKKRLQWSRTGQLASYTDCSGKTTRYGYDVHGRVVEITDALQHTTRIERLPRPDNRA